MSETWGESWADTQKGEQIDKIKVLIVLIWLSSLLKRDFQSVLNLLMDGIDTER